MATLSRRAFLASAALPAMPMAAPRSPNVVLLLADDLGYGELSCQGNPQIPTPHIDSIASSGVRFTQGYVSAPYCTPSRAGLLTGRYQTRFGHEHNVVGASNLAPAIGLPASETTLADSLRGQGYISGAFGKWHLGGAAPYHPLRRGFDEFYGFLHEGHFYVPPPYRGVTTRLRSNEPPYDDENPIYRGQERIVEKEYLTDAITREAVSFITRHRQQPFFLYVAYNAVHSPMQAPTESMRKFNHIGDEHRQVFAAMLSRMDNSVGAILQRLREEKLEQDTLIFFLSDNGGPTAELTSSNAPLRGGKGQLWEGGIREPFLVQWKGTIPGNRVLPQPVISLDIFSTAVGAAGSNAKPRLPLDGVNLLPLLTGASTAPPHDLLFWRYTPSIALRKGDWKLVKQTRPAAPDAEFELYNLAADQSETTNLARQQPDILRALRTDLDRLNSEMIAPRW